jgi:hypothetical protein
MTIKEFITWADSEFPQEPITIGDYSLFKNMFIAKAGKELRLTIPLATDEFNKYWNSKEKSNNIDGLLSNWIDLEDPRKGIEVN